jgi:hypothetical protein
LKTVVTARLAGVYLVGCAAVSARVEMAARARLDVIASSLHVPEQGFAQFNGGCFVVYDSFNPKDWRNGHGGQWREGTQRNANGTNSALRAYVAEISKGGYYC